jgi:SAM-dependent methyltransferase
MALNEEMGAAQVAPKRLYHAPDCDLTLTYQHPAATMPLTVPVHLVCNTPDEILIANIKANSALKREWIAQVPAHDGVALICGSGPSLGDDLGMIDELHSKGGTIFAMNGAASFLAGKGFWADYQVIADAREQTATLIGPARNHIFASQVHPALFAKETDAKLVQVNFYEDHTEFLKLIEDVGPADFALIGSHGSVGNVSLALVYAMGFRNIHVFGFDSSFRDEAGHAFSQPMNVTEPVCQVEYAGKKYQCTFTMKSQADVFPRLAYELEQMGARFTVHGSGFLQDRWNGERAKTLEQREADKYRLMWEQPNYRDWSPGLDNVERAMVTLGISANDSLTDFGCGAGQATLAFRAHGVKAIGIDIARNATDEGGEEDWFFEACLWRLPPIVSDCGLCCDVMEHIPPKKIDDVLSGIARGVKRGAYFAIDSVPDRLGLIIGQPLHLTVRPPAWWKEQLEKHFASVTQHDGGVFVCLHKEEAHESA